VALRALLEQERGSALRLLTSSAGPVQPRSVACIQLLIAAEVEAGAYEPPIDPGALAYAIVRLAEAFLYNDAAFGIRDDWSRLHQVEAALLGIGVIADLDARPVETPIERIYRNVMGRRMPLVIKSVMLSTANRGFYKTAERKSKKLRPPKKKTDKIKFDQP